MKYFRTVLLPEAIEFIDGMRPGTRQRLYRKMGKAEESRDPKIFKKLNCEIWEFRLWHAFTQIRLLAFWDKSDSKNTLVVATHGFSRKQTRCRVKK